MIRETENDELTGVMEELIETYSDEIGDVAVNLCASLVREHKIKYSHCTIKPKFAAKIIVDYTLRCNIL